MTVDPTADAAKLLPCPRCGTYAEVVLGNHIRCGNIYNCDCETRLGIEAWNRRPQPAPPAGESDFHRWLDQKIAEWSAAGGFHDFAVAAKVIRDRLGLAARPKVEDAEVAKCVADLRRIGTGIVSRDEDRIKAADLLERLAASRHHWKCECNTAESTLAERETELARADAVIFGYFERNPPDFSVDDTHAAIARHAARQQQKASAKPTERERR